ncbi:glutathione S-transferase [Qipengyuania marisflavi]|uniref:Glutathione S-transferase n=1 Tax=Qipengyuania marisflavi TaxID=2486356 RepID=A0A5S3P778_9SPHN|nr:glutathione S-transferase [Qipengyuania marisflavi]TMM49098.1 glutathione S-transferase [Qipengyuania marisflavi]
MADMVLYSFRRCPYAMRTRMALAISGCKYQHREVVLRDKPAEMLAASPKGTVPVLVRPDGSVIAESFDIMRWALARSDPEGWLEGDDTALITANDGAFKHHLDRYKYAGRYDDAGASEEHRAAGLAILGELDARLTKSAYLCGERRMLADAAIMPFVRQFAHTDRDWFAAQPLSGVQRWLAEMTASALFTGIMVKHPQWRSAV